MVLKSAHAYCLYINISKKTYVFLDIYTNNISIKWFFINNGVIHKKIILITVELNDESPCTTRMIIETIYIMPMPIYNTSVLMWLRTPFLYYIGSFFFFLQHHEYRPIHIHYNVENHWPAWWIAQMCVCAWIWIFPLKELIHITISDLKIIDKKLILWDCAFYVPTLIYPSFSVSTLIMRNSIYSW